MTQKQLKSRVQDIYRFAKSSQDYLMRRPFPCLEQVAGFAGMLTYLYDEIEEILGVLHCPEGKKQAYEAQSLMNGLIGACEKCINDVTARD